MTRGLVVRVGDETTAVARAVVGDARVPHRVLVLHRAGAVVHEEVVPLLRQHGLGLGHLIGDRRGQPADASVRVGVEGVPHEVFWGGVVHAENHGRSDCGDIDHAAGSCGVGGRGENEGQEKGAHGTSMGESDVV